jgi:hypothetical protein
MFRRIESARSRATPCAPGYHPVAALSPVGELPLDYRSRRRFRPAGFGLGLIPFHSQLLGESLLISFPPLTNMLKFSG